MAELRLALRALLKSPGFTAIAVLSLALGIGANTAIFTLVDQILLRLLPVQNPRELVQLKLEGGRAGNQNGDGVHTFSYPQYLAFRGQNTVFSGIIGHYPDSVSLLGDDRNDTVSVSAVTGNYFEVLGVRAHLGRLFTSEDNKTKNGHPVAVLQYDFWQTRFAGKADLIGSTIRLNGTPFTVVGISAPGFEGTNTGVPTKIFLPVTMKLVITPTWDSLEDERDAWFYIFARLKPGVSIDQAQASMRVLYRQRQEEELKGSYFQKFPDEKTRFLKQTFSLIPASRGQSNLRSRFERPLLVLQWLVAFVLLIACANVANLMLARAAARQREIAIRTALGASRMRIARQLLVESSLLAVTGGLAGLLVSAWVAHGLLLFLPIDPANLSLSTTPDMRVLLFTMAVTGITALLFGSVPALRGSRVAPASTLKEEAGSLAGGSGHVRLRKLLVGLQVGLSTLLLAGAGLFARTLQNLRDVDLGFKTENVVMFRVQPATVYDEPRKTQVIKSLIEGLNTVPGVKAAGANRNTLLTGGRWDSTITIPGVEDKPGNLPWSFFNAITPGYFQALGIPILAGRDLTWNDFASAQKRCLVNEALVKEYLNGENPVGRMMAQGRGSTPDMEIVGVFANARYHDVRGVIPRQTFVSIAGPYLRTMVGATVYARTDRDPRQVMGAIREQVRRIDGNLVISGMRLLDEQLDMRLSNERMLSFLSTGFALLATLLAIVGLYGVLAFVVTRRTREIGIRMALGAERANVIRLVLREMLLVIVLGLAAGVTAGILTGKYVETQLFGVNPKDPAVFVVSVVVLLAASIAAGFIPAWRASRIDPIRALRYE